MSFVNYHTKEINCKIVYYGPGLGGKTTNIQYIYQRTNPNNKGKMVTLNTENERTLFFDFLPLDLGQIRGFKTRFHLYTVPGQVFYEASRKLILRGVDGIVFVADSQVEKMNDNVESLRGLKENLKDQGYDINKIPMVMQWNKRDLPNITPESELENKLNIYEVPAFSSTALNGDGVFETLKAVSKLVLLNIKGGLESSEGESYESISQ
jgi:signal recognition particle receptor subunit beta